MRRGRAVIVAASAAVVVAYLMRKRSLGFEAAFALVAGKRPLVRPALFMFEQQLREFERELGLEAEAADAAHNVDWAAVKHIDNVMF